MKVAFVYNTLEHHRYDVVVFPSKFHRKRKTSNDNPANPSNEIEFFIRPRSSLLEARSQFENALERGFTLSVALQNASAPPLDVVGKQRIPF